MLIPPRPPDEAGRLDALRRLALLDTPQEERFDRLTRIAASVFRVPISLVSLVDSERQWFKSRVGLSATQTPRSVSFCGHAINREEVFIVENAGEDARFADNPLVTGAPRVVFYAGAPLRAPSGERVGTLCVIDHQPRSFDAVDRGLLRDFADLVERELAIPDAVREHLKREQERIELISDAGQIAFWEYDIPANRVDLSKSWSGMLGEVPEAKCMGMDELQALVPAEDRGAYQAAFDRVDRGGEGVYEVEHRVHSEKRGDVWLLSRGRVVERMASGRARRIVGVNFDISRRREAELLLGARERFLQALIDELPAGVGYIDGDMVVRTANQTFADWMQRSPHSLKGRSLTEIIDAAAYARIEPHARAALAGRPASFEIVASMPLGARNLSINFVPDDAAVGAVGGFFALAFDITSLKQADRMKDEFVALVSHELRTPLTSVVASIGLLAGGALGELPPRVSALLEIANANCGRLTLLVNDILDVTRFEAGKLEVRPTRLRPNGVLDDAVQLHQGLASRYGVRLVAHPAQPDAEFLADRERLMQVLANLLSNAIKYSDKGAEILLRAEVLQDRVRLSVRDLGAGVPEANRSQLFQRFGYFGGGQGIAGSGLGLYLSRLLVEAMNGTIDYLPVEPQGSVFRVEFPVLAAA